jgi:hypothetical protein
MYELYMNLHFIFAFSVCIFARQSMTFSVLWLLFDIDVQHKDIFDINTTTGEIKIMKVLDKEKQSIYHFKIKVSIFAFKVSK